MKFSSSLCLLTAASSTATALATRTSHDHPHPALEKRATCTPATLGDTEQDDAPAITAAIKSCGAGGTIVVPAGKTYSLRSILSFAGCVGCDFQLEGTLKVSSDFTYWATQPAIIYLKDIAGAKVRSLTGAGVLDGNGQNAYDEFAANSALARPTALYIVGGSNIYVGGFRVKNPPNVFFGQKGAAVNVQYASLTMTAASKSTNAPKNTDGFDIGESTYTKINDVYVENQDDCIAFKSGSNYVDVQRVTCAGELPVCFSVRFRANSETRNQPRAFSRLPRKGQRRLRQERLRQQRDHDQLRKGRGHQSLPWRVRPRHSHRFQRDVPECDCVRITHSRPSKPTKCGDLIVGSHHWKHADYPTWL